MRERRFNENVNDNITITKTLLKSGIRPPD